MRRRLTVSSNALLLATTHKDAASQARARDDMTSAGVALFHIQWLPVGSLAMAKGLVGWEP